MINDAFLPKGAFAALIGVTPGRVSQMIREGLIGADAIVGEGRHARVRVDLARQHIAVRRKVGQALGNGLSTRLDVPLDVASGLAPGTIRALTSGAASIEDRIKRERLISSRIANRRAEEAEEERRGQYVKAEAVAQQLARIGEAMICAFADALPSIATALSVRFGVDEGETLELLRQEFGALQSLADVVSNKGGTGCYHFATQFGSTRPD